MERVLVWAVVALLVVKASANVADLLVIGVDLDPADPRAYPIEIMNYHEIVNDRIGEKHVAVTWSPLTYSNVVIETEAFLKYVEEGDRGSRVDERKETDKRKAWCGEKIVQRR